MNKTGTVLFIGDSITDCNRRESAYAPLGNGYVNFAGNWLCAQFPELELSVINNGISGNTIRDLAFRWQSDFLHLKPDFATILIGINDVWRRHSGPERLPEAVMPDEYETIYRKLLSDAVQNGIRNLIIIEPFMFCNDTHNRMYKDLQDYINIARRLAEEFGILNIPAQKLLDPLLQKTKPDRWSTDMVHPTAFGHAWIAQQWLKYLSSTYL